MSFESFDEYDSLLNEMGELAECVSEFDTEFCVGQSSSTLPLVFYRLSDALEESGRIPGSSIFSKEVGLSGIANDTHCFSL